MKNDNQLNTTWIDGGMRVIGLTLLASLCSFICEYAYLSHFGAPLEYTQVSLHEPVMFVFVLLFIIGVGLLNTVWTFIPRRVPRRLSNALLPLLTAEMAYSALTILYGLRLSLWIVVTSAVSVIAVILFLVPAFKQKAIAGYWRKVAAEYDAPREMESVPGSFLGFTVSGTFVAGISFFAFSLLLAGGLGYFYAKTRVEFLMPEDRSRNCIVLRFSDAGYLCAGLDVERRLTTGWFMVIKADQASLQLRHVGPVSGRRSIEAP